MIIVDNIPTVLRDTNQWICWKYARRKGVETKVPVQPRIRKATDVKDRDCWVSFETALGVFSRSTTLSGVAFVFSDEDAFAGVDLDDCLDEQGQFTWGEDIVRRLDSYCEVSPKGSGVKLFLYGKKPAWAQCTVGGFGPDGIGKVEIFDRARCFATTGRRLDWLPSDVLHRQPQLDALCERRWPQKRAEESQRYEGLDPDVFETLNSADPDRLQACLEAMRSMQLVYRSDGSHRLFAACCRCVEFDLTDSESLLVIRRYELSYPFPRMWTDPEIVKRIRSAEQRVQRGAAIQQPTVTPSLLSVGQLLHKHPALRSPVIHGLMRAGETMNVIAPPKYKKSWLVIDLALSVATGRPWLETFGTKKSQVLILDNELHVRSGNGLKTSGWNSRLSSS